MVTSLLRSSLVLRTTLLVLGVALAVGLIGNEVIGRLAAGYETARTQDRINGLLTVVEPSASAACFVGDRRLAEETAQGLLKSPSLAAVEIRAGEGVLARAERPGWTPGTLEIVHPLDSPFTKGVVVGELRAAADAAETARQVSRYVWTLRGLVFLLATAMGGALALTVMRTVVQPIKQMSDRLNDLDASHGMRLEVPLGHEADEIGRLAEKVNEALLAVEERHRLEQEVQQAQAQKISSLGSLAGGVAHDFNNMLAGIMGHADLLLADERDPKRQKRINAILGAAARSSELTGKLLAFGRRGKNRKEAVDLSAAVKECLALIQPSIHPDLLVFTRMEEGLVVDGDPSQIQQVLVNLCINAAEAMQGKGSLTISTRLVDLEGMEAAAHKLTPGLYIELQVADTGPGMDEETLQRIFEPFFTTKTTKEHMGTGLGLSTVYGIVGAHHGTIEVTSRVTVGSVFRVYLPLGRLAPERPRQPRAPGSGKGMVLVVEDEPSLRELARSVLEELGYSVETAVDGRAGVAAFETCHQDLHAVLLDLKMPNMGGHDAFHHMRKINASVPVIICTGFGENEEVQDILTHGGAGLLHKPYRVLQLAEALEQAGSRV